MTYSLEGCCSTQLSYGQSLDDDDRNKNAKDDALAIIVVGAKGFEPSNLRPSGPKPGPQRRGRAAARRPCVVAQGTDRVNQRP